MAEQSTVNPAYTCPICSERFNSKFELDFHTYKKHPTAAIQDNTPITPVTTLTRPTVKPQATQQEELIIEYNLAQSKAGLGELCPVLKDKDGNIIDGFHRKGENADWREETIPWIDTPVKLELARLAVNFNRRKVTPQELSERITFLIKAGVSVEEIASQTGISTRTIYKYKPANLKNPERVKTGREGAEKLAESVQQRVNTSDNTQQTTPSIDKQNINNLSTQFQEDKEKLAEGYQASAAEDVQIANESYTRKETTHACLCPNCGKLITTCPREAYVT